MSSVSDIRLSAIGGSPQSIRSPDDWGRWSRTRPGTHGLPDPCGPGACPESKPGFGGDAYEILFDRLWVPPSGDVSSDQTAPVVSAIAPTATANAHRLPSASAR